MAHEAFGPPLRETLSRWKREQAQLKASVIDHDTEAWQQKTDFTGLFRVGGVDISFIKGDDVRACASLVVLSYPELEVLYEEHRMVNLTAPYISGFLAFREVSFLVDAIQRLQKKKPDLMPQVLLVDGNGVLHHRGYLQLEFPKSKRRKTLSSFPDTRPQGNQDPASSWLCFQLFLPDLEWPVTLASLQIFLALG